MERPPTLLASPMEAIPWRPPMPWPGAPAIPVSPQAARVARVTRQDDQASGETETPPGAEPIGRPVRMPLPPTRPFEVSQASGPR